MIILAVDLGTKRTGFAMCDPQEKMALALPTLMDVAPVDVAAIAQERGAEEIVVGLPLNMDGTVGPSARRVLEFIDELKLQVIVPVVPWDERLSTAEGQTRMREQGLTRKDRDRRADVAAAIVILESYLRRRR
ncbi:MAG TPA: Holliday junction resolvase RuvX [Planctomycetota bacterium]|nr:Holliday junction resolvase RuvX [Planctomycetota bacterium]